MSLDSIIHLLNKNLGILLKNITYFFYRNSNTNILFEFLYFMYKKILRIIPITPYKTINHEEYLNIHDSSLKFILEKREYGYTSNLIFDLNSPDHTLIRVMMSDVMLYGHKNVRIQGNSDFIMNVEENYAINDLAYNIDERFELFDGILLNQKGNMVLLRYDNVRCDRILRNGIMLSGRFSSNYYHILYELLIKFILLDKIPVSQDVPVIVDSIVLEVESFRNIFNSLNKSGREVVYIGGKEVIAFEQLYSLTAINIIPPHYKDALRNCFAEDIKFDLNIVNQMRNRLLVMSSRKEFPKKLFIARNKNRLRSFNEDEVIELLVQFGFEVVRPEEYSFFEQMALFNGADFIIGGTGAAMSNLLFCNKGSKVICFNSNYNNNSVFSTIAYSQGVDMRYCIGVPVKSQKKKKDDIHADFYVDINKLKEMLVMLIR